ncbi:MAG: glycosyltransferase family 9 protein, partial [Pseudomonadota bacterium]|nr:glycosyltransferase family 9 protein [Pseudomonadota bacterium]
DSYDDLVGVGDLSDVAHLLSRCDFFVGNDSGLMHMSAALGVPTLGLFGPSRTEQYAPWGPKCGYVRTKDSYEEIVGAPGYDHRTTGSLMGGLSVDAVESAARQLVERIGTSQ